MNMIDLQHLHHGDTDIKKYEVKCMSGQQASLTDISLQLTVGQLCDFGVKEVTFSCCAKDSNKMEGLVAKIVDKTNRQTVNIFERMMKGQQRFPNVKSGTRLD